LHDRALDGEIALRPRVNGGVHVGMEAVPLIPIGISSGVTGLRPPKKGPAHEGQPVKV